MFRCIVNEGCTDEWIAAGESRDDVEEIVRSGYRDARTKRFFAIKPDGRPPKKQGAAS